MRSRSGEIFHNRRINQRKHRNPVILILDLVPSDIAKSVHAGFFLRLRYQQLFSKKHCNKERLKRIVCVISFSVFAILRNQFRILRYFLFCLGHVKDSMTLCQMQSSHRIKNLYQCILNLFVNRMQVHKQFMA